MRIVLPSPATPLLGLLLSIGTGTAAFAGPPVAPRVANAPQPAAAPGLFGVVLGASPEALLEDFAPAGRTEAAFWSRHTEGRVQRLLWTCPEEAGCMAAPSAAEFSFVDGKLAAAALRIDGNRAPPELNLHPLLSLQSAAAGLKSPAAEARFEGTDRRRRYYRDRPGETVVWVDDGPVVELKLYLDRLHPVGFAEAVAAKARPVGLEKLPGGKAWAAAQYALDQGQSADAIHILDDVYTARGVSPLMVAEARLVQALALAARAKARNALQPEAAQADLKRARSLAPGLAEALDGLAAELKSP
jgi:hypothetical protein